MVFVLVSYEVFCGFMWVLGVTGFLVFVVRCYS